MMEMDQRQRYTEILEEVWGDRLTVERGTAPNELYLILDHRYTGRLIEICSTLLSSFKARLVTLVPIDERGSMGLLFVHYVFSVPHDDLFLIVKVPVDPRHMEIPSIATHIDAANWFEREMKDWFGIIAFPNIYRLASHPDWPDDVHPMLKDFASDQTVARVKGVFEFEQVGGEGIFEIPVGPVHAGIIEPGHFRFSVAGEPIITLGAQLYYTHKGTEKRAEGMSPEQAVFLAERISGDTSFGHALAYCHALERTNGIEIPENALVARTILLELERICNHAGDIGAIMLDVGYGVGASLASRLKEQVLRTNEVLTGSRLLRGMVTPGGLRRSINDTAVKKSVLHEITTTWRRSFEEMVRFAMASSSMLDRLETTGQLSHKEAHRLGIVGMVGRASGIDRDFRRDHPHGKYGDLPFRTVLREEGDVFARFRIRIDEVRHSCDLIGRLLGLFDNGPIRSEVATVRPDAWALGYAEGWRGELVHWVMTDRDGKIARWRITDPSSHNWRGLLIAVRNNIVPDFPVINKSFNLSYSGNDR